MSTIISILGTEKRTAVDGSTYHISHVVAGDGTEAEFFHRELEQKPKLGDQVKVFFHYGKVKCELNQKTEVG